MNAQLLQAARGHSNDMLARNYFDHYTQGTGESPGDRIKAAGYESRTAGENIAYTASSNDQGDTTVAVVLHDQLFIDKDYPDRGHRVSILRPDFYEIGVGFASGGSIDPRYSYAYYISTDFGRQLDDSRAFVTGVVYNDNNKNGRYDGGDTGIPELKIKILETEATTYSATAGGYGIPLIAGDYTLRFEGQSVGGNLGNLDIPISIRGVNIKIDAETLNFPTVSSSTSTTSTSTSTTTTTTFDSVPKQPPVAIISVDPETGPAPLPVTFDGSGSYDPDGGNLTYAWYYAGQPKSEEAIIGFTLADVADYVFTLVVTDDEGDQHSQDVTIVVTDETITTTTSSTLTTTTTTTTTTTPQSGGGCSRLELKGQTITEDYSATVNCDILVQNVVVGGANGAGHLYLDSSTKVEIQPPFQVHYGSTFHAQ